MRKTIPVEHIRNVVNEFLKDSPDEMKEERLLVSNLVEQILKPYTYSGWNYLRSDHVPETNTAGIMWDENNKAIVLDESRREYPIVE